MTSRLLAALAVLAGACAPSAPAGAPAQDGVGLPETALAILERRCFECHGPQAKKVKSGLRLSGREALLRGGDHGPSVVPGDPEASLLVQAIRWEDEDLEMPPKDRLPPEEVAALEAWVAAGAEWPAGNGP
ncbi:MAG TPA: c-type cytochrome domain-containing protein, partial [Planctomycetota bacterium]|nr:c-type cytochrome domain-containing protein [Planctomycetota bacterium]